MRAIKLLVVVVLGLVIASAIAVAYFHLHAAQCKARADAMGVSHEFTWDGGCLVRVGGRRVPMDQVLFWVPVKF